MAPRHNHVDETIKNFIAKVAAEQLLPDAARHRLEELARQEALSNEAAIEALIRSAGDPDDDNSQENPRTSSAGTS